MKNKKKMSKQTKLIIIICVVAAVVIATVSTILLVINSKGSNTAEQTTKLTEKVTEKNSDTTKASDTTAAETSLTEQRKADDKYYVEATYNQTADDEYSSTIELSYPVASVEEYGEGATEFNDMVENYKDSIVNDFYSTVGEGAGAVNVKSDYEIYNRTDGAQSVLLKITVSGSAAHPTVYNKSFNYDMNSKSVLYIPPYCKCDTDTFHQIAQMLIARDIANNSGEYYDGVAEDIASYYPSCSMVFDESKVYFIFAPEAIAPRSGGEKVFEYSYSDFN